MRMLRITWIEHVNNEEFFFSEEHLAFLCHMMRKVCLEKLTPTGYTESKSDRERQGT